MADSYLVRILRIEMKRRDLNQQSLAVAAGLNDDAIRNIFREASGMPRVSTLVALADLFDVSVDYLIRPPKRRAASTGAGGVAVPQIPEERPGALEWEEIRRFWEVASPDARRALVYLVRTMAAAEGIKPGREGGTEEE